MKTKTTFFVLLTALVCTGLYGLLSIINTNNSELEPGLNTTSETVTQADVTTPTIAKHNTTQAVAHSNVSTDTDYQKNINAVRQLLAADKFEEAISLIDTLYSQSSTDKIQELNSLIFIKAKALKGSGHTDQAISLLKEFTNSFNELEGWTLLSDILFSDKQWLPVIDSLLKATALEYRPEQLERLMGNLVAAASYQRTVLEGQKDELSINRLYKKLYEHHPENARFQLEFAFSYLRMNDSVTARGLLEPLQYDNEYGEIAKTTLASINNDSKLQPAEATIKEQPRNEIVVPLLRSGNSFFVNTLVNNRQFRLLLDTGASITVLSKTAIESLKLKATGHSIKLQTANGVRTSKLYRADHIKLGKLSINNLTVAEIEFEKNSQIHGLLGTDLLNKLDNGYSYIIDNQKNALIFRSK